MSPSDRDGQFFAQDGSLLESLFVHGGAGRLDASGHTMGATDWTDLAFEALDGQRAKSEVTTKTGPSSVVPVLGIGIEVPAASAVQGNVLDVAADPGHTFVYVADSSGLTMLSFGPGQPIGVMNKTQFQSGNLPGNPSWPLSGNANVWTFPLTSEQLAAAKAAIDAFVAKVPNYTPTTQCTSAALSIAKATGLALPNGLGPVKAESYGVSVWSGNVANPFALNQQLTTAFGPPTVVNTSQFKRR